MVIDFEARLFFHSSICPADISKEIEAALGPRLQKQASVNNMLAGDNYRSFSKSLNDLTHPFRMLTL